MFLSRHSFISAWTSGSSQVWQNVARFWRELPDYGLKHVVILQCEVGLSRRLDEAGFELTALCDYRAMLPILAKTAKPDRVATWLGAPVNVTHWGWRLLVRDFGCPFVKVQLFRDNPKGIRDIEDWESIISEHSSYDTVLIRRHL